MQIDSLHIGKPNSLFGEGEDLVDPYGPDSAPYGPSIGTGLDDRAMEKGPSNSVKSV